MSTFFRLNGALNPPPPSGRTTPSGTKLSNSKTGLRLLPDETVDFPKLVHTKRGKQSGKPILNKRININDQAFQTSLTHENPDRVQPPSGPPTRGKLLLVNPKEEIEKAPKFTQRSLQFINPHSSRRKRSPLKRTHKKRKTRR